MKKQTWMKASLALVGAAVLAIGCSPQPKAVAVPVNDKFYSVTPDALKVKVGIVTGEMTELKVMERVEDGSGRITAPAKLTGKLVLKNVSTDQTVRLLNGKISYIDVAGKPIKLEDNRTEPLLKLSSSYGTADRLDPGQDTTQAIDVEFPAEALKLKRLKDIRLGLSYIPTPYREENLNFPVSIGAAPAKK
jgi:hypothetical protein